MRGRIGGGLAERIKAAGDKDSTIVVPKSKLGESAGYSEEYFEYLGLSKQDLKNMEKEGLAMRGYLPKANTSGGHQVRWVLLVEDESNG